MLEISIWYRNMRGGTFQSLEPIGFGDISCVAKHDVQLGGPSIHAFLTMGVNGPGTQAHYFLSMAAQAFAGSIPEQPWLVWGKQAALKHQVLALRPFRPSSEFQSLWGRSEELVSVFQRVRRSCFVSRISAV